MMYYNFDRVFKARGIDKPFSFLQKAGFSDNFASRIKNNRASRLNLKHLERLCLILKCTPNDFMQWVPDKNTEYDESHPINTLRRSIDEIDMVKTISSIPLGKLEQINKLIKEELNK